MRTLRAALATTLVIAASLGLGCGGGSNLPPPSPRVAPLSPSASTPSTLPETALGLYTKACDEGSADGCNSLGVKLLDGARGAVRDTARAEAVLQKSCDLGSLAGCGNLGFALRAVDEVRSIGLLMRACDGSWWEACFWLADTCSQGPREDLPLAVALLTRACNGKHQRSCASLGIFYETGSGVAKDPAKAAMLFESSCDADVPVGCAFWANAMVSSAGPPDVERARGLFEKGCTDAFPLGCYMFGSACESGQLGDDYVPRAEPLLRRACEHGVGNACARLAQRLENQ